MYDMIISYVWFRYQKSLFFAQTDFYGVDLSPLRDAAIHNHFGQPIVDAFDPSILLDQPVSTRGHAL